MPCSCWVQGFILSLSKLFTSVSLLTLVCYIRGLYNLFQGFGVSRKNAKMVTFRCACSSIFSSRQRSRYVFALCPVMVPGSSSISTGCQLLIFAPVQRFPILLAGGVKHLTPCAVLLCAAVAALQVLPFLFMPEALTLPFSPFWDSIIDL